MSNLEPGLPAQALGTPSALGSWSDQRQARLLLTLCGGRCGPTLGAVGPPLAPNGLQVRRSRQSGSGEGFEEGFETCVRAEYCRPVSSRLSSLLGGGLCAHVCTHACLSVHVCYVLT